MAPVICKGEGGICITLTEPEGGSDLANLTTTAVKTPDGQHYIVNGVKKFITGGTVATFFSTAVRTGGPGVGGVSLMIIERDLPGVTVKKLEAQGWWSGNTTLVTFEDVKVKATNLIGKEGTAERHSCAPPAAHSMRRARLQLPRHRHERRASDWCRLGDSRRARLSG